MKKKYIISLILWCLFAVSPVWADDSKETWAANTVVDDREFTQDGTVLIYLMGDITINGTLTLNGTNTTVRFVNTSGKELTIHNGRTNTRGSKKPMFKVINGAKLAFNYKDSKVVDDVTIIKSDGSNVLNHYQPIIIDGGADFNEMIVDSDDEKEWTMNANNPDCLFRSAIIQSVGALELYYVTIRNFHGQEAANNNGNYYSRCGAISLVPTYFYKNENASGGTEDETNDETGDETTEEVSQNKPYRYTRLVNCLFEKCKARAGTVLNVGDYRYLDNTLDPNNDDRLITLQNCTIKHCVTYGDKDGWGGMIRFKGGSVHSINLKNCTFEENFSYGDGAGVWWNAAANPNAKCTIDGCQFINNRAMRECGALRLETTFAFEGGTTTVSGNKCFGLDKFTKDALGSYVTSSKGNGGGISIYGYASTAYEVGGTFEYNLPKCLVVNNNYAKGYGGGIVFDFTNETALTDNTVINAHFNGATISNNKSASNGGGVYFRNETEPTKNYTFNIYLNSGSITGNNAPNGGGLYVSNLDIQSNSSDEINIKNNQATDGSGGGIYLKNGNISLTKVNITGNTSIVEDKTSFAGGGGIYVENGEFTIVSGEISENSSSAFGGGVLVQSNTTGEDKQVVTLSGGIIKDNEAHYGGGLAALGNLSLTLNQVNIENNTATNGNGGGVFVRGGITSEHEDYATLTYNAGIVQQNTATCTGTKPTTAYGNNSNANVTYASVAGMGGGICLGMNTTLQFGENLSSFGIYDNVADSGADDLFATENNTVVNLPDVKAMQLQGYDESESHTLFWFEDYITDDPNYDKGTKLKGEAWDSDKTNQRYRYVRNGGDGETFYYKFEEGVSSKELDNKYLCLTLGWNVGLITLIKNGMADGENAIFQILKKKDDSYKEYMTVILTDADKKDSKRSKQITLDEDGTWKIVETPWSWAYTSDYPDGIERTLDASSSVSERTFEFTNTVKTNNPIHGESVKVNKMGKDVQQE